MKKIIKFFVNVYEYIFIFSCGIASLIHKLFVKTFPTTAIVFAVLFFIGIENSFKSGNVDFVAVIITLLVFAIISLIYAVDRLYSKLKCQYKSKGEI